MRIKTVSFGFTRNLGNFQSARADCTVELTEGESWDDAMALAAAVTKETLDIELDADEKGMLRQAQRRDITATGS